jgi:hypothetical protein
MRYTVVTSRVRVIGPIWQPGITAAQEYTLSQYDLENVRAYGEQGEVTRGWPFTREAVEHWLSLNTGDFQSITDFCADISFDVDGVPVDIVFDWEDEESEFVYHDCMFGDED